MVFDSFDLRLKPLRTVFSTVFNTFTLGETGRNSPPAVILLSELLKGGILFGQRFSTFSQINLRGVSGQSLITSGCLSGCLRVSLFDSSFSEILTRERDKRAVKSVKMCNTPVYIWVYMVHGVSVQRDVREGYTY